MSRQRYCKVCEGWHDTDEPLPQACYRAPEGSLSIQIVRDIEPYMAVAGDVANGGKPPVIGGRAQHREFLKRNNYFEVGNSFVKPMREQLPQHERISDIKRALGES